MRCSCNFLLLMLPISIILFTSAPVVSAANTYDDEADTLHKLLGQQEIQPKALPYYDNYQFQSRNRIKPRWRHVPTVVQEPFAAISLCDYPTPSRATFHEVCGDYQGTPFICDPQHGLSNEEASLIDHVLRRYNVASCFCQTGNDCSLPPNSNLKKNSISNSNLNSSSTKLTVAVAFVKQALGFGWFQACNNNNNDNNGNYIPNFDVYHWRTITAHQAADWIRNSWNSAKSSSKCSTDVLIFMVESWLHRSTTGSDLNISEPLMTIAVSFDHFMLPLQLAAHVHSLASAAQSRAKLNQTIDHLLNSFTSPSQLSSLAMSSSSSMLSSKINIKGAPTWALVLLVGGSIGGLILAYIGNCISRSRHRRTRSSALVKTTKKTWKVGFSGGVWGKQAAGGTQTSVAFATKPRRTLFVR